MLLQNGVWIPTFGLLSAVQDYPVTYMEVYCKSATIQYGLLTDIKYAEIPVKEFSLSQNYPNPFNPSTEISYSLNKAGLISLKIFDVLGNEISELVNEYKNPGKYNVKFNASNFSSGIYFYRIKSGPFLETRKMILMK